MFLPNEHLEFSHKTHCSQLQHHANLNRKRQRINCTFVQIKVCRQKIKYTYDTNYPLKTAYIKLSDNSILFQCLALRTGNVAKVITKIKRHSHLRLFVTHHTIPKGLKRLQINFPCQCENPLSLNIYDLTSYCIMVLRDRCC